MSSPATPDSLPALEAFDSETEGGNSPDEFSPLYQSLMEALRHPNCVSAAWIDTVADFKNNPRALHSVPYNDGSVHWVDKAGHILHMAFPAELDMDGKFGCTGPYFNLGGEQEIKVI